MGTGSPSSQRAHLRTPRWQLLRGRCSSCSARTLQTPASPLAFTLTASALPTRRGRGFPLAGTSTETAELVYWWEVRSEKVLRGSAAAQPAGWVERTEVRGKTCVVTGANSGIGRETALALAGKGAQVVLLCRSAERGEEAREAIATETGNEDVSLILADLADSASVRRFAETFVERHDKLDVLVNNAGVYLPERQLTEEGHELTFAINHLGPFLLTNLLLPTLKKAPEARVVTVSSLVHYIGNIDLDDLALERGYQGMLSYARSKLANILFTHALADRLEGTSVTANCLHPGAIRSGFAQDEPGFFQQIVRLGGPFLLSPARGARTSIWLASAPEAAAHNGGYFVRCRRRRPSPRARNEALAEALWARSASLMGVG